MWKSMLVAAFGCGLLITVPAQSDQRTAEERLLDLEAKNAEILRRLEASEARNRGLEAEVGTLRSEQMALATEAEESALEEQVNTLSESVRDGMSFKDLTRSGYPIKFYGFFRNDVNWSAARMNNAVLPVFVLAENDTAAEDSNDDEFTIDARLTRFGFDVDAGTIGSAKVTGKLETDFSNHPTGSSDSRATPRIRLAYLNLAFGDFSIRLGQDWDVIAPLMPAVGGQMLLWGVGNLGDRRPMVQFHFKTGDPTGTEFTVKAALGLTGAVDTQDLDAGTGVVKPFTSTLIDGYDSGHPHGQLRLGMSTPSWVEGKRLSVGAYGYLAGLETDAQFGGEDHFTAWAMGLDAEIPLFDRFSLRGELFIGQALADVRGGILQSINGVSGDEIEDWGGWVELVWQIDDMWRLSLGGSVDNADSDDLLVGARDRNWSAYANLLANFGGGLKMGLDAVYWETQYVDTGLGNTIRFSFYAQLDF